MATTISAMAGHEKAGKSMVKSWRNLANGGLFLVPDGCSWVKHGSAMDSAGYYVVQEILMTFDHVAVPSTNLPASILWYRERFNARVIYEDADWAFLEVGGQKLAIVRPQKFPPHVAYRVSEEQLHDVAMLTQLPIEARKDGSRGLYLHDPTGNAVQIICYPAGKTVYDKE